MEASLSRRQFGIGSISLLGSLLAGKVRAELEPPQVPPDDSLAPAANAPATQPAEPRKKVLPRGCVIPGTGARLRNSGVDFEDEMWVYYPQAPKSSFNIDKNMRVPGGITANSLWVEAGKRGQPDIVKRVKTPHGGMPGSTGCMLLQTLYSGTPSRTSGQLQQDDFLHNIHGQVGRSLPVSWTPNCVCRVYIPTERYWERRTGPSFGFRAGLWGYTPRGGSDEYWPGMFLEQTVQMIQGIRHEKMRVLVRGDGWGRDIPSISFDPDSWCTLGMTFTPDGQCHFFAKPGTENLTAEDHVGSYHSYSYRAHTFETFFFNVMNIDDGVSMSTPLIIDNAMMYVATPPRSTVTAERPTAPGGVR
jgi:hypothetical protein